MPHCEFYDESCCILIQETDTDKLINKIKFLENRIQELENFVFEEKAGLSDISTAPIFRSECHFERQDDQDFLFQCKAVEL